MNRYRTAHRFIQIAAVDRAGVIGVDGDLPFRLKGDLPRFKRLTMGKPMLMGRKTFESLPGTLPGRQHVILTRQSEVSHRGRHTRPLKTLARTPVGGGWNLLWARRVDYAVRAPELQGHAEVYVVGGGEIYRLLLEDCDMVRLTYVPRELEVAEDAEVVTYPLEGVRGFYCVHGEPVFVDGELSHVYLDAQRDLPDKEELHTLGHAIDYWNQQADKG